MTKNKGNDLTLAPDSKLNLIPLYNSRCAEKYSRTCLDTAAKRNWLEMGLLSI